MGKVTTKGSSVGKKRLGQMKSKTLQMRRTPQPLFTPQERYEIHENWRKRNQEAHEPGLFERATQGLFEYFDPTPKYRPNAGPHMMSVATDANDIVTLMRYWDVLQSSGEITMRELIHCQTWVIHLVALRLKKEGYFRKNDHAYNRKKEKVGDEVSVLLEAHQLKQLQSHTPNMQNYTKVQPKLPATGPTAEEIKRYIQNIDTEMIIKMILNNTWKAKSIYRLNWHVFQH